MAVISLQDNRFSCVGRSVVEDLFLIFQLSGYRIEWFVVSVSGVLASWDWEDPYVCPCGQQACSRPLLRVLPSVCLY